MLVKESLIKHKRSLRNRPAKAFSITKLNISADIESTQPQNKNKLEIVTRKVKKTINSADQVPPENFTWSPVQTLMQRPKSLDLGDIHRDWLHQLRKAYVVHAPNGFIGDNVIFDEEHYYSFEKWWLGNTWEVYRHAERVQLETAWVISIAAWGGEAFQHFIIDVFAKLASVIDLLESPEYQHIKIASHYNHCPIAQWFWHKVGLENRLIQKPLNAKEKFVISTPMALYADFHPSHENFGVYPRGTLLPLQKRLGLLDSTVQDLVIYLPRTGRREVTNQKALLCMLNEHLSTTRYSLHEFKASGDFDRDLSIMRRAKLVLGPHGGAFANLAFTQPDTHVIEFLPIYDLMNDINTSGRNYWGLSQAASLDYWTLKPDEFSFDGPMVINCKQLENILFKIL